MNRLKPSVDSDLENVTSKITGVASKAVMSTPRRWYRFSLRTLLIGVVVLCLPLGYVAHEARIVRERKAMLVELQSEGGAYRDAAGSTKLTVDDLPIQGGDTDGLPTIRAWLGDEYITNLWIPQTVLIADVKRFGERFPEARVWQLDPESMARHYRKQQSGRITVQPQPSSAP